MTELNFENQLFAESVSVFKSRQYLVSPKSTMTEEYNFTYELSPRIEDLNQQAKHFADLVLTNIDSKHLITKTQKIRTFDDLHELISDSYVYSYCKACYLAHCVETSDSSFARFQMPTNSLVFEGHQVLFNHLRLGIFRATDQVSQSSLTRRLSFCEGFVASLEEEPIFNSSLPKSPYDPKFSNIRLENILSDLRANYSDRLSIVQLSDEALFIENPNMSPLGAMCYCDNESCIKFLPMRTISMTAQYWNTAVGVNLLTEHAVGNTTVYQSDDIDDRNVSTLTEKVSAITGYDPEYLSCGSSFQGLAESHSSDITPGDHPGGRNDTSSSQIRNDQYGNYKKKTNNNNSRKRKRRGGGGVQSPQNHSFSTITSNVIKAVQKHGHNVGVKRILPSLFAFTTEVLTKDMQTRQIKNEVSKILGVVNNSVIHTESKRKLAAVGFPGFRVQYDEGNAKITFEAKEE
jgi:hypothetical protein